MVALSIAVPIVGGLLLLVSFVTFLYVFASFVVLWYDRRLGQSGLVVSPHTPPARGTRQASWWRTSIMEYLATLASVLAYPLGWFVFHPTRHRWGPRRGTGRRPVLLIHGLRHNQSAWLWHRRQLRKAGLGPIYTLNLLPLSGSVKTFAQLVADKAVQIEKETGTSDLSLVGHSMGGLVGTYYAERLAPYGKVSRLVTLGTPLHGTRAALLAGGLASTEMVPGSELLEEIDQALFGSKATAYYHLSSLRDNLILPNGSAVRGQHADRERILSWQGHMTLLFSREASQQVIQWLTEPVSARQRIRQASTGSSDPDCYANLGKG